MNLQHQPQNGVVLPPLSSFVCDWEQDEPFSEEDLRAIEAIESRFYNNKRPFSNSSAAKDDGDDASPDNSARRSHRRRRLPRSLVALQHPNALSLSPCQGYSRMRLPVIKFAGQIMYSRTFADVEKSAEKLLKILEEKKRQMVQIPLGFDIEWKPSFRSGVPPGKVAVMQICHGTSHCHVLHLIHSGIPKNLQILLEDPLILKVGAGIRGDAAKVFRDYKISVKGLEDLSFHANKKLGGSPHHWGLASLAEKLLSKQLKKPNKIRLGNWETPVLSKEQLEYAATDAFASWHLFQAIKDLPEAQVESTDKSGKVEDVPQQ
ncbi:3'-5' exonuclease [Arachis stenosperma]|uniref:3'-5' exonuclease n=1 Tax=Arachis stenosperma TaxID=217475 RepID=UPI0025AD3445|nr:3'-5' exonuclease [Arachis stenosperma]